MRAADIVLEMWYEGDPCKEDCFETTSGSPSYISFPGTDRRLGATAPELPVDARKEIMFVQWARRLEAPFEWPVGLAHLYKHVISESES